MRCDQSSLAELRANLDENERCAACRDAPLACIDCWDAHCEAERDEEDARETEAELTRWGSR